MALTRPLRFQLALAILFILLGAGNIIFGSYRAREYQDALLKASQAVISPERPTKSLTLPETLAQESLSSSQEAYLAQLRVRYDFYRFVLVGGKWMLALAGFLLLLALVGMAEERSPQSAPKE